jgi:hypothetical protein
MVTGILATYSEQWEVTALKREPRWVGTSVVCNLLPEYNVVDAEDSVTGSNGVEEQLAFLVGLRP